MLPLLTNVEAVVLCVLCWQSCGIDLDYAFSLSLLRSYHPVLLSPPGRCHFLLSLSRLDLFLLLHHHSYRLS